MPHDTLCSIRSDQSANLMYAKELQKWLVATGFDISELIETLEEFLSNTPTILSDDISSMLEYFDKETIANFLKVLKK